MANDIVRIPHQGDISDLSGWIAGELGGARARLFDTPHVFNPGDTPASYHEASFVGYAPQGPVVWNPPFINVGGKAESDSQVLTWTFSAGVGTATVYGWFLTDATGLKLLAACSFVSPVVLQPASPSLSRIIQMTAVGEL